MTAIDDSLARAVDHHNAGRLGEAEAIYRRILADRPRHADALHLMGLVAQRGGNHRTAVEYLEEAVAERADGVFLANLAESYRALGRAGAAVDHARRAVTAAPELAIAHNHLGLALMDDGKLEEAEPALAEAARLAPDNGPYRNNLGIVLDRLGRHERAADMFRQASMIDPDHLPTRLNLGRALERLGDLNGAANHLREAVRLAPEAMAPRLQLSRVLRRKGQPEDAIAVIEDGLETVVAGAAFRNALGLCHLDLGRSARAAEIFTAAARQFPDDGELRGNLATAQLRLGDTAGALKTARAAAALAPDDPRLFSNVLMMRLYQGAATTEQDVAEHRAWSHRHAAIHALDYRQHANVPDPNRPLRVGYVSPDFREHAVGRFIAAVLRQHNRAGISVHVYSDVAEADAVTRRIRDLDLHYTETRTLGDDKLASRIRADGIDVLVDLAGHSAGNRLLVFARRPAPVQVAYLGYPDTTGLAAMDYRLTDPTIDPPGAERGYTERLLRLKQGVYTFDGSGAPEPMVPRERPLVLGSFCHGWKISESTVALWARAMAALPEATLLLKSPSFAERAAAERMLGRLTSAGVDGARVLCAAGDADWARHMARYNDVDIALDSYPYAGTATTMEALWMGVPVITMAGSAAMTRTGAAILGRAGLGDLVAGAPDDFVARVKKLATEGERRRRLRTELRPHLLESPLGPNNVVVNAIERAYRVAWQTWCATQAHRRAS